MAWRITLRLQHPSHDPARLDAATGSPAKQSWAAGDPRRTPKGAPLEGLRAESYATYPLAEGEGQDLAMGLEQALALIEPRAAALDALGDELRRELFIGWFLQDGLGGDVLPPALLRRLAASDLALSFDLYGA